MASRVLLATISVVALLVIAGCLGAAPQTAAKSTDGATVRTISVDATGTAVADPDLAVIRVAVVSEAETAEAARDRTASAVRTMRDALRAYDVSDAAVRTTHFRIDPVYDHRTDSRDLVGFQASHGFELEVDPDRAGEIIDVAVDGGANRIDGVQFTLTSATRTALRANALQNAMTAARADADTIAAASTVTITGVNSASTGSVGFIPVEARREAVADGTVIEPGPVTVTATVHVTYTIDG